MRKTFVALSLLILFALLFPANVIGETDCRKLSRKECLASRECALDYCASGKPVNRTQLCYSCRPRTGRCGAGFSHRDVESRKAECESRPGCGVRVDCYCPCEDPDDPQYRRCVCQCVGGLPADCIEKPLKSAAPPPVRR